MCHRPEFIKRLPNISRQHIFLLLFHSAKAGNFIPEISEDRAGTLSSEVAFFVLPLTFPY